MRNIRIWFPVMGLGSFFRPPSAAVVPASRSSAPLPSAAAAPALSLDAAATGLPCRVVGVKSPELAPSWGRWLAEIGFLPGERVTVTTRSVWGGDPLVVRVGQSTFALRRAEAACVRVEPL